MRRRLGLIGGFAVAALVTVYPLPAGAHDGGGTFTQENLVSDQAGVAQLQDDQLVNAWGMSRGPNTPIWVSDNGADASTLYSGAVGNPESPVAKNPSDPPGHRGRSADRAGLQRCLDDQPDGLPGPGHHHCRAVHVRR